MIFVLANVNYFLYMKQIRAALQAKLAKYKMNPQYPSFNQIKHDALVSGTTMTKDHHFDLDPGDDIGELLRSCRRDSALPSLGRQ